MSGRVLFLAVGLIGTLVSSRASAVSIELVPNASTVASGQSVDIAVVVSGLGNGAAPSLGAYDLQVTFDPSRFALGSVIYGADLGVVGLGEANTITTPAAASVRAYELSLLASAILNGQQADRFTLFTLRLTATATGPAPFGASLNAPLADQLGAPLAPVTVVPAQVLVSAPIPTLSEWGLIALIVALAIVGVRRLGGGTV